MSAAELGVLAERAVERAFGAHETIFQEGDPSAGLFVIRTGVVTIVSEQVGRPVDPVARLGPSDYFGEMGLLDGGVGIAFRRPAEEDVEAALRQLLGKPQR